MVALKGLMQQFSALISIQHICSVHPIMLDNTFKAAFPFESKQKSLIEVLVHLDFVDRYLKYEARECEGKSTTIIRSQTKVRKRKKIL